MPRESDPAEATDGVDHQWLTPEQLETWKTVNLLLMTLPSALDRQLHAESNLSLVEYYVLAALSDEPDHTIRLSRLAVLANAELSRLSHLITRLERRGLVRRQTDQTDGRFTQAILTEQGYAHLREAAPGHVRTVRQTVFDPLSRAQQTALGDAARAIANVLPELRNLSLSDPPTPGNDAAAYPRDPIVNEAVRETPGDHEPK